MKNIEQIVKAQHDYYLLGETNSIDFRLNQLKKLKKAIVDNENLIANALKLDLGKSAFESYICETGLALHELSYFIKHIKKWAKPKRVATPLAHFISSSYIYSQPYGVTLIMSPWNYPVLLTLSPLIGAIAGGNTCVVKPSAYSSNTSKLLGDIISKTFDEKYISVIEGGRKENTTLLDQKFDYIFFTGSVAVGKIVMERAAKNLTPITLELGGKSPCIVDETANIDLAAKRLIWGKFINSSQTCVAPDYLLVHKDVKAELIESMKKYIVKFYGKDPLNNDNFPKMISEKHYNNAKSLIDGDILIGGKYSDKKLKIEPTLINNVTFKDKIMENEIFAPLLPIIEYEDLDTVLDIVVSRPKALALYIFSTSKKNQEHIISKVPYGGGCINDTLVHLATTSLPFNGIGESGMGSYHGKASFDTFTSKKSILKKSNLIDVPLRYPAEKNSIKLMKMFLK